MSVINRMPVWKQDDANCCPTDGVVNMRFQLYCRRIKIMSKHFSPLARPVE